VSAEVLLVKGVRMHARLWPGLQGSRRRRDESTRKSAVTLSAGVFRFGVAKRTRCHLLEPHDELVLLII
jgi:hypothetical protein